MCLLDAKPYSTSQPTNENVSWPQAVCVYVCSEKILFNASAA